MLTKPAAAAIAATTVVLTILAAPAHAGGKSSGGATVAWTGNGTSATGPASRTLDSTLCAPASGADASGNYLLFVLASTGGITASPTIRVGASSATMVKSNTAKRGQSAYKYVWTSGPAIDLYRLLTQVGVSATWTGSGSPTLTVSHGCVDAASVDTQPPTVAAQNYTYETPATASITLATVTATDNVAVTGFRFVHANSSTSTTSEDGWFQIDASGNVSLTTAGAASAANDFGTNPNSWTYNVQAGDADGNWSTTAALTLAELTSAIPTLAPQKFGYTTSAVAGATLATVVATDVTGVTGFRFVHSNNTTSTTSEDGWFQIDASGNISLTTAGAASAANNVGTPSNTWDESVQAGNAGGRWSPAATMTLVESAYPFQIRDASVVTWQTWMGPSGTVIIGLWVPALGIDPLDPTQTWSYFHNGVKISPPDSTPIDFTDTVWQGQVQWTMPGNPLVLTAGDTLQFECIVDGVRYRTQVFTVL